MATLARQNSRRGFSALVRFVRSQGALVALALLVLFGALRYDRFLSTYNIQSFLSFNAMFALVSLGMVFVIITGGVDLSVGSVAAFASVVAALLSSYGLLPALLGALLAATLLGLFNGLAIAVLKIPFFITTLATLLGARGLALILADNQSVSVSYDTNFVELGQGYWLGVPIPVLIAGVVFAIGMVVLGHTRFGRRVLAVGGNAEASRLMGLRVDRILIAVYTLSGALAGLAGVILAAQFGAGQPLEGQGWELSAIASVVVGGTLLTGGKGTVSGTLVGALLLGLIFNLLNFENGRGLISLSSYWQSVIRGLFLLVVILLQTRLARSGLAKAGGG